MLSVEYNKKKEIPAVIWYIHILILLERSSLEEILSTTIMDGREQCVYIVEMRREKKKEILGIQVTSSSQQQKASQAL